VDPWRRRDGTGGRMKEKKESLCVDRKEREELFASKDAYAYK
jgi:hypothetical protein